MIRVTEIFHSIQGESTFAGRPCVFVRLTGCPLRCTWCFEGTTRVLKADWSWQPISLLQIGDIVVGFAQTEPGGRFKLVPAVVRNVLTRWSSLIRLVTERAEILCTPNHKFLEVTHRNFWKQARSFQHGDWIRYVGDAEDGAKNSEYARGWMAGMAAGDGCFWTLKKAGKEYRRFRLALTDYEPLLTFSDYASKAGFSVYWGNHNRTGFSRKRETMKALWLTRNGDARALECFLEQDRDDSSYRRGWLAGFYDAEGSWSGYVSFAQDKASRHLSRLTSYLSREGFHPAVTEKGLRLGGSISESVKFFSRCTPVLTRKTNGLLGKAPNSSVEVLSVSDGGDQSLVYNLTTSTGNYVAEGMAVKNCDTEYAFHGGSDMTVGQVLERVREYGCRLVEVTGGEPLAQPDAVPLLSRLCEEDFTVLLETSGAVDTSLVDPLVHIILDVKCPGSGMMERMHWPNVERLRQQDEAKFVIQDRIDYDWAKAVAARYGLTDRCPVLFSPVFGVLDPRQLAEWILADRLPVKLQLQMHKHIWAPDMRGV